MTDEVMELAETVWSFMQLGQPPAVAGLMLVFGTNDLRVATVAAGYFQAGLAPMAMTTGGKSGVQ